MFPCKLMGEKEKYRTFQDVLVLENDNLSDEHTHSQIVSFFNSIVEVFYIQCTILVSL